MTKPTGKKPRPLTNKQLMFISEYLVDMNASKAAIRAGYSENASNVRAAQLMDDERIQKAIQKELNARKERLRLSADDILIRLMEVAQLDIKDFLSWDEDGRVTFRRSDEINGRFVKSIKGKTKKFGVTHKKKDGEVVAEYADTVEHEFEFELVSQDKAVDLLFKHFGLGAPIKVDETVPFAQLVAGALEAVRNVSTED